MLQAHTVKVRRLLTELAGGSYSFGPPKSAAGLRTVVIPDVILADLTWHLGRFAGAAEDALVFTSPTGATLRHDNFRYREWLPAIQAAGLPGIHFHDLRHAGNTFAADAGANLRELMERMGHSSSRAALICPHATSERQRTVADAVSEMTRSALGRSARPASSRKRSGTRVARQRNGTA